MSEPNPVVEELLKGFGARAEELLQSKERMAGLLEAVVAVAEDLSLDAVLERVVESACRLLHARFGALGVIGDDHALSHFITVGIDGELARQIGPLPTGHGVLGLLITDPGRCGCMNCASIPRPTDSPRTTRPCSPSWGSRSASGTWCSATSTSRKRKAGSDFTAEDEALAVALAAAAGVAIENARLYDDARRRARWLEACMDVSGLMLSTDRDYTSGGLDPIAGRALQESASSTGPAGGTRRQWRRPTW